MAGAFELLLAVTGVGPRLALAVISTVSPDVLTGAISREEPGVLQRVPGIGKKTAQRILFHLRDKLRIDQLPAGISPLTDVDAEVMAALTALGYSVVEAQTAVQRLPRDPTLNPCEINRCSRSRGNGEPAVAKHHRQYFATFDKIYEFHAGFGR